MIFDCFFLKGCFEAALGELIRRGGFNPCHGFGALTEMLKQESLIASFQGFTELIILKVLEAHRDEEKDVS